MLVTDRKNNDSQFFLLLSLITASVIIFYQTPVVAMWIGFALAGYSAIANDSIQTLGTFINSNKNKPWWLLWLFIGGIMAAVFLYGWLYNTGDVAYGRLTRIDQPTTFSFLQLMTPVVLLILTRLRMPVSTTFLLLSVFSSSKTVTAMLQKTAIGYILAFTSAMLLWSIISQLIKRQIYFHTTYNQRAWRLLQWLSTAFLWSSWLMQDTANVVVFLPRALPLPSLIAVITFLSLALGILLYLRGGKIQSIVHEKTDVVDVRSATIIDFVLAILLVVFKQWNDIPMSTTWVFLGLLAGRELALSRLDNGDRPYSKTFKLVLKDISSAFLGLVISLLIAWLAQGGFK